VGERALVRQGGLIPLVEDADEVDEREELHVRERERDGVVI